LCCACCRSDLNICSSNRRAAEPDERSAQAGDPDTTPACDTATAAAHGDESTDGNPPAHKHANCRIADFASAASSDAAPHGRAEPVSTYGTGVEHGTASADCRAAPQVNRYAIG
jgi:hypothetical protein